MCVFVVILSLGLLAASEQYVVNTAQGRLRGEENGGYISFKGVPYASISSPDHRFKRAGLAPSWQGVRESDEVGCSEVSPAEHCLRLDVHAPLTGAQPRPVLAWLSGARLRPDALLAQGIIVVIIHHRVGPQGFLCLGEDMIPGNAGVKDVVLALRWIRDNIVAFKGDAAKVVMAGQGFGAAVAEAVMLSPMASSLYHGVILQSGTALAPWAFNYDAKERAIKLAETISANYNLSATLLTSPFDELVDKSNKLDVPYFPFGICVENAMKHEERSVSEPPFDTLSSKKVGKVPMIIGYNKDEAYIFASFLSDAKVTHTISQNMRILLPEELKFINDRERTQVAKQVEDIYFKTDKSLRAVLDYHRDVYFVSHIHRSARLHALASQPVYFYQFSYSGERGVQGQAGVPRAGAAHSDELAYLFAGKLDGDDGAVQMHLVKLWTNFVKYLDPTSKEPTRWEILDPAQPRLLDIGAETAMADFPQSHASTWNNIYDTYYYSRHRRAG